ncbi:hypothetical protein Tco_1277272, partial [Tanacetum coccineum]
PKVGQAMLQQSVRTDTGAEGMTEGRKQNRNKSKSWKIGEKKVRRLTWHLETLMTLVALRIWLRIVLWILVHRYMLPCKEELERFRLHSSKVRLADDNTLDIASIRDVVLKTSFGTSWTLKDVRYISCLKRRLISVGKLDKEGYHVASETSSGRIGMSMLASKGNVPDVRKVDIYFCKSGSLGKQKNLSFIMSVKTKKLQRICGRIVMLKMVPKTPLQFGVAERLSQTFRAESTGIRADVPKMLWANSVKEEWRGKDTSLTHLKEVAQMKCDTAFGIRRVTRLSEAKILHLRTRFMESENDSIDAEHVLSSEITQSPGGSSDTSEGSENSGSFEDSRKSDEDYSEDRASSKEGGSETPQVRISTRESRAPVRYSPSANYLLLTENGEPESYSEALSSKESIQ